METNEIMDNEEVMETTTEVIETASSGKGLKITAGIGLAVLAGAAIYKYVGKPMIAKFKAKKEQQAMKEELMEVEDIVDENVDSEEN